jgi:hypothetical protein
MIKPKYQSLMNGNEMGAEISRPIGSRSSGRPMSMAMSKYSTNRPIHTAKHSTRSSALQSSGGLRKGMIGLTTDKENNDA